MTDAISHRINGGDIKDLAQAMIDLYGADADLEAAQRGDECLARGEEAAARAWLGVAATIRRLVVPAGTVH